jgi:hypothetical protein
MYRNTQAPEGTIISIKVTGKTGGEWKIKRESEHWQFTNDLAVVATTIELDPDTSWKLFTKALRKEEALNKVQITGDEKLAEPVLRMLAVMA